MVSRHCDTILLFTLIIVFSLGLVSLMSQNAFALAPTISSYVADDPDNLDGVYSDGDTITITLSAASNVTAQVVQDAAITGNFTFTNGDPLTGGADFEGEWISNSVLVITMNTIGTAITLGSSDVDVNAGGPNNIGPLNNGTDNTVMVAAANVVLSGDFGIVASSSDSNGGGDGCKGDCEEPTIGVDSNGKRQVSNGFSYNGYAVDVERFFTPYPLITANVGKINIAEFKIYENQGVQNIKHFTFAFGMDKDDIISNSKAKIELDIDFDGTETVTVTDPENALDNIKVTTSKVSCTENSTSECLKVAIQHRFRAPLDFNIVGTDVWDTKRSSWQNYYNHGIEVVGESLNPPKEYDGINKGHIYHLTETGKTSAVDEFGNTWSLKHDQWMMDYVLPDKVQDPPTMVMTRTHSDFAEYKINQAGNAISYLLEFCPICLKQYDDFNDSLSYEYPERIDRMSNPAIQKLMSEEELKSTKYLTQVFEQMYSGMVFD